MRGCVMILIDESAAMRAPVSPDSKKTKAEDVATAINSLLGRLARAADADLAVVGYRTEADDTVSIGCRWSGPLASRELVPTAELAASPVTVERRTRKVPGPTGTTEQTVDFPIWYQPATGAKAPQVAAFDYARRLIADWAARLGADAAQPLVLHVLAGASGDGNPLRTIQELQQMAVPGGAPLVLHAHLTPSESAAVPATLYPATRARLTPGLMRDLFERASVLPPGLAEALRKLKVTIQPDARGMIFNARLVDLARFLALAETYVKQVPAGAPAPVPLPVPTPVPSPISDEVPSPAPESLPPLPEPLPEPILGIDLPLPADAGTAGPALAALSPDQPGLVLFVLDRSVANPYGTEAKNACSRLQEQMGDMVEMIVKFGRGSIDVGVISYGADSGGGSEVRAALEGRLAGRPFARDDELRNGAVRVESFEEERSDGGGGILTIPHCRPILVEAEPTPAAPATPAFVKTAELIAAWSAEHPASPNSPIVIHLTRGAPDAADTEEAARQVTTIACSVALYHVVETEASHPSVLFPDAVSDKEDPALQVLWRLSSPLLGRETLAAEKPTISPQSRGFVVNGRSNLLMEALKRAVLAP